MRWEFRATRGNLLQSNYRNNNTDEITKAAGQIIGCLSLHSEDGLIKLFCQILIR